MKKRLLALAIAAVLSITTLLACSSKEEKSSESTKAAKVVLNEVAHSIFYAPMYVAIEEGYFQDEGIDLELITGFGVSYLVQRI